ncbi:hypothetical protein PPYR_01479 [Photinus pyralis]|uniref:Methyltransferase domain-containing protein n=1 Tax=Photinus pyralis TaxID=7054 RepID=A0A5N4B4G0_PHOPY|nr:juvenile hormone acid O-methyltransferase-like [Photinus pyralis]KAB0804509.1 hypothetical protein PPYR_01479 [Photinus pyralis]
MNSVQSFLRSSKIFQGDAKYLIDKIKGDIKWKRNCKVLDVGCGPGNYTHDVLLPILPQSTTVVIGVDKWPEAIDYANSNYGKFGDILFKEMDIAHEQNTNYHTYFDHVFSFDRLQSVGLQETALRNIRKMLKPGGDFFFSCAANLNLFDIYSFMSKKDKWRSYLANYTKDMPPYKYSRHPKESLREELLKVEFQEVHIEIVPNRCVIPLALYPEFITSRIPFPIPPQLKSAFVFSSLQALKELKFDKFIDGEEVYVLEMQGIYGHVTRRRI